MTIYSYNYNKAHSITFNNGIQVLISYETLVAAKIRGKVYIDENYYNYSRATNDHIGWFCGNKAKAIKKPSSFFEDLM